MSLGDKLEGSLSPKKKRARKSLSEPSEKRHALVNITNQPRGRREKAVVSKEDKSSTGTLNPSLPQTRSDTTHTGPLHAQKQRDHCTDQDGEDAQINFVEGDEMEVDHESDSFDEEMEDDESSESGEESRLEKETACSDYATEIDNTLRLEEARNQEGKKKSSFSNVQKDINKGMRGILVDWLVEVAAEFKLSPQTLYLAVDYIDRYITRRQVTRKTLQLVGVSCMFLASKYEEVYPPKVDDFVYISDNTYTRNEVLKMEQDVFKTLDYRLTVPTLFNFLQRYLSLVDGFSAHNENLAHLACYLAELTLPHYKFFKYPPSLVATASVCLALHTMNMPGWKQTLSRHIQFDRSLFDECLNNLHQLYVSAPKAQLKAVFNKYSHDKYLKVSDFKTITPRPIEKVNYGS